MKASAANLLSLIKGPKQFIIPIYQRAYSWQLTQCEQLLADVLRISDSNDQHGHFVGSVVYFQESIHTVSDVPRLLVIDGQQRLTTITLLIAALAKIIKDTPELIDTTATKLSNYYLFNAEEEGELRYKLLLTRHDKHTLLSLLEGHPYTNSVAQRIIDNYHFFEKNINTQNAEAIYNGLMRLFIVDVALEKEIDNPQLIFESLNSTGLALSQADLVRNYILMGQSHNLQTELYERYWFPMEQSFGNEYIQRFDAFMRDYLSVKTGNIANIMAVYEAFKKYALNQQGVNIIPELVADLHRFSIYYVNMVLHKEPSPILLKVLKRISKLKVDVSYPFLLAIYADYQQGMLSETDFEKILCLVENYIFRRMICGIPTNSLNKTFLTLYKSVRKDSYLESVQAAFLLLTSYKRFPTDKEFITELVCKDVYHFRNRNYLLDRLENANRKEPIIVDDYTIEHVLPQNPNLSSEWQTMLGDDWAQVQEMWLHTLGNLTLTGYNAELSDHPFNKKQQMEGGFNDSPLRLNEYLRTVSEWNADTIQARANLLAEKAQYIWFAPKLAPEILQKYQKRLTTTAYSIEQFDYLTGDMLALYQQFRQRVLNIDSSVTEECKKIYIAFKATTNFVDVVPQKSRLRLSLNMPYADILDPKSLCKDVTNIGRWGNGDIELGLTKLSELEDVMALVQQAFDAQAE